MCKDDGIYGCEEVTIGFTNKGLGYERVDFMSMNSKGIIKCFEIKVTVQDLNSSAKKSWYGNYNYLVVSESLYNKIHDWTRYLPEGVGLMMKYEKKLMSKYDFECIIPSKKRKISLEDGIVLKESLVRSLYYKMIKYMNLQDVAIMDDILKELKTLKDKIEKYENLKRVNEGGRKSLDQMIETELRKSKTIAEEEKFF